MCYSYPSEKWWRESQLGYVGMMMWKFSQYDGKVIKFHGSSHHQPVSVIEIRHQSNFSGTSHPHPWDHLLGRAWWPSKGAINIEQLYITYVVSKRYVLNRLYIMWFIPTYINLHFFQLLHNIHLAQNVGVSLGNWRAVASFSWLFFQGKNKQHFTSSHVVQVLLHLGFIGFQQNFLAKNGQTPTHKNGHHRVTIGTCWDYAWATFGPGEVTLLFKWS